MGTQGSVEKSAGPFFFQSRMTNLDRTDFAVCLLASVNLGIEGTAKWIDILTNAAHFLVPLGQVAVAVATVYYIIRKARAIKVPKK